MAYELLKICESYQEGKLQVYRANGICNVICHRPSLPRYKNYCSVWIPFLCPCLFLCPYPCPCLCSSLCPCPCLCQFLYGAMKIYGRYGNYLVDSQCLSEIVWKLKRPLTWEKMDEISLKSWSLSLWKRPIDWYPFQQNLSSWTVLLSWFSCEMLICILNHVLLKLMITGTSSKYICHEKRGSRNLSSLFSRLNLFHVLFFIFLPNFLNLPFASSSI
jgi:hypothetical protein